MLAPPSKTLRSAILNLKLQPTLLTPCVATWTTSTTTTQRRFQCRNASTAHNPQLFTHSPTPLQSPSKSLPLPPFRTITQTASPSPITPSPSSPTPTTTPLTWNAFLTLRRTRRRYNLISSLFSSLFTTTAGISYLAQQSLENVGVFGLDPFIVLGLATMGSGGVGWLVGPTVGNKVFGWRYRRLGGEIDAKEKDLFARIKKHRVDPAGASTSNPVPDYYGEKIDSVQGYRNWMKDQRAFNKKRQNFL